MHPLAERWAGSICTLDGRPAKVVGRVNPFATVAPVESLDDNYAGFQWSWEAVDRIMKAGGNFVSGGSNE